MTVDIGAAIGVGEDLEAKSKDPLQTIKDVIDLYHTYHDVHTIAGVGNILKAMDKNGELAPAVQAIVDIAPILLLMLKDDAEKAKILALVASA